MLLLKTLGPNGTVIIMVSWKAGSRQGGPARETLGLFGAFVAENGVQKVPFENPEIKNGTEIKLFIKVQHLDPLKTLPGSGFENTWKSMKTESENQWFLIV